MGTTDVIINANDEGSMTFWETVKGKKQWWIHLPDGADMRPAYLQQSRNNGQNDLCASTVGMYTMYFTLGELCWSK